MYDDWFVDVLGDCIPFRFDTIQFQFLSISVFIGKAHLPAVAVDENEREVYRPFICLRFLYADMGFEIKNNVLIAALLIK